jgi:hypothetical protein
VRAENQLSSGADPAFANAIRAIHDGLASLSVLRAADVAAHDCPNQPLTIVPLALGLAAGFFIEP